MNRIQAVPELSGAGAACFLTLKGEQKSGRRGCMRTAARWEYSQYRNKNFIVSGTEMGYYVNVTSFKMRR